ncbi:MAG: 4-hydroxy-tetrahydrodipicolinate synthase [Arenimonas sp.]|uniref:4-hydroxy-tetrahydrodipicolinate synthase n=1 Tax=Arenimonas sp. TaxID=1872635 RepID=UPI0025C007DB|nr:4-hydroxy-tetrahydrodipicolinate synthase [Arenimonas sp.]MBW8366465.1 4-hydroxy-tetrahydrodipicolinate synthase [Arenimonas sp.]
MHLYGSITALATPFTAAGDIDFDAWTRLIDRQIAGGSRGIVVAGSTGEAAALSDPEFSSLLAAAVAQVAGRMVVLAGTGQSNTAKTIAQTGLAAAGGADAALVVTPPYVRPTQEGLVAHYRAVAEHGGLPVVLYNVPGRTGCDLLPSTVAQLCRHPGIVGLKEARGDRERWEALCPLAGDDFALLSGDDPTFVGAILGGARGVISVASNVVPGTFSRLCELAAAGEASAAQALEAPLLELYDFLGIEPNPIPVKALLSRFGIGHGLRLPLLTLSPGHNARADAMAALCQQIEHPRP